jgi:UDP-N-acetylglucosamine 2-epimerase (non-hydrolysing)
MHKILTIFGTRPEAIKLSPVVKELSKHPHKFKSVVGVTGQHDELLKQVLNLFKIKPDFNLMVMQKNQSLTELTSSILKEIGERISEVEPDIILIQGDTTTVFATALAAFYQKVKIGHVEAGLRTNDKYQPFPEEMNRCMTDQMSDIFFAPTETNRLNLLKNGIPDQKIHVTGNTIVDALLDISSRNRFNNDVLHSANGKMVLVTAHRRENFGKPLENVFQAIHKLAGMYSDIQFICPVHPNPNVRNTVHGILSGIKNVSIIAPLDYLSFVQLMAKAHFILTDSGGIQEEAPSLKKPLLILRNKTERPEVVDAGGAKIVGTSKEMIIHEFTRLIEDDEYYKSMSNIRNPYGDGTAAKKIVKILQEYL